MSNLTIGQLEDDRGNDHFFLTGEDGSKVLHHRQLFHRTIDIDEAIDLIGIGKFQHIILVSAGVCFAADAIEITLLSFLTPVLKLEWDLSTSQAASITSCVFAGSLLGTLTLGPLGDRRGRHPVFLLSAGIIAFFGFSTALAESYGVLIFMRFMVGYGVGGLTAPFDLLLEVLPTAERGKYLLWIEFFWSLGSMAVPLIAWVTIGNNKESSSSSWKTFVLVAACPCVLGVLVGLCCVPESPRWLVEVGRTEQALEVLRRAAQTNGKDPDQLFPNDGTLRLVVHKDQDQHYPTPSSSKGFTELLSPTWRRLIVFIWILWFGFAFAYYGTILIIARVFEIDGYDENQDNRADFDYMAIFVSSTAEIFGLCVVLLTIDRWGRIPTQIVCYGLGGLSVFSLCYLVDGSDHAGGLSATTLAFLARSFEMGASCVTWVSTPEMLPTELRSTGHSSANAVARLGAFISPFVVQGDGLTLMTVGWITLVIHIITMIATSRLPETNGMALGNMKQANVQDNGIQMNNSENANVI